VKLSYYFFTYYQNIYDGPLNNVNFVSSLNFVAREKHIREIQSENLGIARRLEKAQPVINADRLVSCFTALNISVVFFSNLFEVNKKSSLLFTALNMVLLHVLLCFTCHLTFMVWFRFMVFNATFINISVILWRSVLLVEETGVPVENH